MPESNSPYKQEGVREFYAQRKFDTPFQHLRESELPDLIEEREDMKVFRGRNQEQYAQYIEQIHSPEARETFEKACDICQAMNEAGGKGLVVGGAVRDEILGVASKDFDLEIYGLEPEVIEKIVQRFGKVKDVGKSFGILNLVTETGIGIDISLPRTDSRDVEGYHVKADPNMSVAEAGKRRDFSFNALSKDPITGEIYDPYGGVEDLKTRTLRVTDPERFQDDALRLFRGTQFAGRFGLKAEPNTLKLMKEMVPMLKEISVDRIRTEWEKLLLRSAKPSKGLEMLKEIGIIAEYYPELAALQGCEQEFEWHPEGDAWVHTLIVADAAKDTVDRNNLEEDTARVVMLSSLCHDLGKPDTTEVIDGRITSHRHDIDGVVPVQSFLERIGTRKKDIEKVCKLTKEHMWPTNVYINLLKTKEKEDGAKEGEKKDDRQRVNPGAFRRLAKRIHPATIKELTYVTEADCMGVGPLLDPENPNQLMMKNTATIGLEAGRWVREKAKEVDAYDKKPGRFISGNELMALGFVVKDLKKGNRKFGVIIKLADDCRDLLEMDKETLNEILQSCGGDEDEAVAKLEKKLEKIKN